jgi:cytochrome c biogenesis protein CcmG, thiol:disulfide interchange protein DsbE
MKQRSWLVWIPLLCLAFFAGLALYRLSNPNSDYVPTQMVGQQLPAFDLSPAIPDGDRLSSKDFADGKPKLLNLFASWCIPCKAEAPMLDRLKQSGVEIHAIALKDKPDDVSAFLAEFGNPFVRIGADPDMLMQVKLGTTGIPETYVIDGKGVIRHHHIGDIRDEHIPVLLEKLAQAK